MKIHASYFILWALGYIYTSAEGITTAHVDSWNTNSSCPQNCLGFWLVFLLLLCLCTLREHFYMKLATRISHWSHLAPWVLSPVVTDLWDIFAKLRNSNILWYYHPKCICHRLATGAFGLSVLVLSHHAKNFSKKITQFFQGKMSNTSTVVLLYSSTSTINLISVE